MTVDHRKGPHDTVAEQRVSRHAVMVIAIGLIASIVASSCSALPPHADRPSSSTAVKAYGARADSRTPQDTTTTMAPDPVPTTSTTVPFAKLSLGSTGPAVLALQQQLTSLGYWLGTPNGTFGNSTQQAVFAFQKAAGISRDGVVGPVTSAALAQGIVPQPRSTSGYVIEVDLEDDLMLFVTNGKLDYVLNTSTGGGYRYTDQGVTSVAVTPTGHFDVYRQVDGIVTDTLGQLWRPKFFEGGFAIHGDSSVPPYPASHGCARVSNEAIDWIWSQNLAPLGTAVWVY
jgi:peptidoglycan hydrolase-like protein with peptidoglycan-binding domain